jgi:DNA-binding MarR family transcriptional regulator
MREPAKRAALNSPSVSIVVRLLATQNLLLSALRRGFDNELTLARFDLLAQLSREGGQTLAQLSRGMLVTAGNLTGLVDRAERDGIVERRPDPSDRRLTRVYLTDEGEQMAERAVAVHAELAEEILAPLAESERQQLGVLLGKLRIVLDQAVAGVPANEPDPDEIPEATRGRSGRRAAVSLPRDGRARDVKEIKRR